jgi:hypothetical protein
MVYSDYGFLNFVQHVTKRTEYPGSDLVLYMPRHFSAKDKQIQFSEVKDDR